MPESHNEYSALNQLDIPLPDFSAPQVHRIGELAPLVFEPLLRPFRTQRIQREFSMSHTLRNIRKSGIILPGYHHRPIATRTAKLVIAMSLSGIDRCYAVGLIPLLARLRTLIDFDIYIYTTRLLKAQMDQHAFRNDYMLDWNHVYGPYVFRELAHALAQQKGEKAELLIIDSCGANDDSEWYFQWSQKMETACIEEFNQAVGPQYIQELRKKLKGQTQLWQSANTRAREWIQARIARNEERFIRSPALGEYLVRWLLHPHKQPRQSPIHQRNGIHGAFPAQVDLHRSLLDLKHHVKHLHWMNPSGTNTSELNSILSIKVIDYTHTAQTLRDFGQVLSNICHRKCTHKLTRPTIVIHAAQPKTANLQDEINGDLNRTQEAPVLVKDKKPPRRAIPPYPSLPPTTLTIKYKGRDGSEKQREEAFAKIHPHWGSRDYLGLDELIELEMRSVFSRLDLEAATDPDLSPATRLYLYEQVQLRLRTHSLHFWATEKELLTHFQIHPNPPVKAEASALRLLKDSKVHDTARIFQQCKPQLLEAFQWISQSYQERMDTIPLYQLTWKERGDFSPNHLSIALRPDQPVGPTLFHETGHYLEHISGEVASFCAAYLQDRLGKNPQEVSLGGGEYGHLNKLKPWVQNYSGKTYKPVHRQLPIRTEILSTGFECFAHPSTLCQLIACDYSLFCFTAFVIAGGPLHCMEKLQEYKKARSFRTPQQAHHRYSGYRYRHRRTTNKGKGKMGFGI